MKLMSKSRLAVTNGLQPLQMTRHILTITLGKKDECLSCTDVSHQIAKHACKNLTAKHKKSPTAKLYAANHPLTTLPHSHPLPNPTSLFPPPICFTTSSHDTTTLNTILSNQQVTTLDDQHASFNTIFLTTLN